MRDHFVFGEGFALAKHKMISRSTLHFEEISPLIKKIRRQCLTRLE